MHILNGRRPFSSVGCFRKFFWTPAILIFTAALLHTMVELTQTYLAYPISTTITVVNLQQVVFPAITICNMNPIKKSAFGMMAGKTSGEAKKRRKRATGSCLKSRIWGFGVRGFGDGNLINMSVSMKHNNSGWTWYNSIAAMKTTLNNTRNFNLNKIPKSYILESREPLNILGQRPIYLRDPRVTEVNGRSYNTLIKH